MWTVQHVNEDIDIDEDGNMIVVEADEFLVVRYVGGETGWEAHPFGVCYDREHAQKFADALNSRVQLRLVQHGVWGAETGVRISLP